LGRRRGAFTRELVELLGEGAAAAIGEVDRQGVAEDLPDLRDLEAAALTGVRLEGEQEGLALAHALRDSIRATKRALSRSSPSWVTWRSPLRRSRWALRRRMVLGRTAMASASSTPVV
jgi:hypothetical protein